MGRSTVFVCAMLAALPAAAQTTTTNCRTDQWGNTTCTSEKQPGIDWTILKPPQAPPPLPAPRTVYVPQVAPPSTTSDPGPGVPFERGSQFVRLCESDKWKIACMGYTIGVLHSSPTETASFCPPAGVDAGQFYAIALRYMQAHPQKTHNAVHSLILESWAEAFPCR